MSEENINQGGLSESDESNIHVPLETYEAEKKLNDTLLKVGLSVREAKIFICLCNLGPQPGSTIANNLDMKRTTVYHCLQRLAEKGYVFPHKQASITYFKLNPINEAILKIENQREELSRQKNYLSEIASQIHVQIGSAHKSGQILFREYKGLPELKRLKLSTLKPKGEIRIFASLDGKGEFTGIQTDSLLRNYIENSQEKNVQIRIIIPESAKPSETISKLQSPNIKIKSVAKYRFPISDHIEVNILQDQLVIFSKGLGATIESKELAAIQRSAFDLAWMGAESLEKNPPKKHFFI